jgi:hypothetical protein
MVARKAYVSSDMAHDEQLFDVAQENPVAALLWPWFITYLDDWGRGIASPKRIKSKMFPNVSAVTVDLIDSAIHLFAQSGLLELYRDDKHKYFAVPMDKWFEWQTHIRKEKRIKDESKYPPCPSDCAHSRADARSSAISLAECEKADIEVENSPFCTPSPSPSPSPTLTSAKGKEFAQLQSDGAQSSTGNDADGARALDVPAEKSDDYSQDFLAFWEAYPRRSDKRRAWRVWKTRLREGYAVQDMIQAATHYAAYCQVRGTTTEYIKHPGTFLGPDKPFEEYVSGIPPDSTSQKATGLDAVKQVAKRYAQEGNT